jgi:hypothetical protein
VAIQNALPQEQVSVGTSSLIFSQTFGGAIFISFAETTFSNGLESAIAALATGIIAQTVIDAGAAALRDVVPENLLEGVLEAYCQAISHTFYLSAGAAVRAFVFCWGMGWKSVKKAKVMRPEA